MPEEEKKQDEPSEKKAESSSWNEKLAALIIPLVLTGGVGAGMKWLNINDLPKVALGAGFGGIGSIVCIFLAPTWKKTKKGVEQAGEATANRVEATTQAIIARATGVDATYLEAQKLACQTDRCQGVMQNTVPLLEEIYVPLAVGDTQIAAGWQADLECIGVTNLTIWQLIRRAEKAGTGQMAILAWGGCGKTTLLKHITYIYSSEQHDREDIAVPARLPVFLSLGECWRKYWAGKDSLPNLADTIAQYHIASLPMEQKLTIPSSWIQDKLKDGKMIVLFDGLDEVPKDHRPTVSRWIDQQVGKLQKTIFIVTSRPKAYQEEAKASRLSLRQILWVEPFNKDQQQQFINRWFLYQERYANNGRDTADVRQFAQQSANSLWGQIQARPEIQDLVKIPLLLNMIATFYRSAGKPQLPQRRVDLYQRVCDLQLKDRPEAKELETLLVRTDAQTILQKLALEMLLNDREKTVDRRTVIARLSNYLQAENESADATIFLEDIVRISELLIEKDVDSYEFVHWSFQEYLAAREILRRQQESFLYEKLSFSEWKPTILFYAGLVQNPNVLLQEMLQRGATDLAYTCLQETRKQVDAEIRQQLQSSDGKVLESISLRIGVTSHISLEIQAARYAKLEEILKAGEWEAADKETYRLMITDPSVGKEEGQLFDREDLENFSCEALLAIDKLWVDYSQGKFGFSVQKKIWQECGSPMDYSKEWEDFGDLVGWRKDSDWLRYSNLQKNPELSSPGELPRFGGKVMWWEAVGGLFAHAETCKL